MKTVAAGMALRHGGSSACIQLGTTVNMMHDAITSKTTCLCSAGCSVFCSDVMMPFCCKDTLLFDVLCKLEDGIRDFYVVAHQYLELCSAS